MAANRGGVVSSATTTISDGPANAAATPTDPATSRLATATQMLPGPGDHVDRRDRLGAVGHGGDGLRAADGVDLVDTGERGGRERDGRDRARFAVGRHAQHDLVDPGHLRRHDGHQHGRRVGAPTAGHVDTGAGDGHRSPVDHDAVALVAVRQRTCVS